MEGRQGAPGRSTCSRAKGARVALALTLHRVCALSRHVSQNPFLASDRKKVGIKGDDPRFFKWFFGDGEEKPAEVRTPHAACCRRDTQCCGLARPELRRACCLYSIFLHWVRSRSSKTLRRV